MLPHRFIGPCLSILPFLLAYCPQCPAIDLIEEGKRIIIQKDVEHVLVRLDIAPSLRNLENIGESITSAHRALAGNALNSEAEGSLKPLFKQLEFLAKETEFRKTTLLKNFIMNKQQKAVIKWGMKILGDILSWGTSCPGGQASTALGITGRYQKPSNAEMRSTVLLGTQTNRPLLRTLNLHDSQINSHTESLAVLRRDISKKKYYTQNLLEVLNFKLKTELQLTILDSLNTRVSTNLQE